MNNIVRMQSGAPAVGARDGQWMWDGSNWVCDPDCGQRPGWQPPPPWFPPPATSPPWYPGGNAGVSFSPPGNPPPNPIRGNFWWDGSTLWMFDGAAWVATGGASGGGTTPPSSTAPANPQPGQQWFNGTTLFVWDGTAWVPVSQTKTSIQATAPPSPNPGDLWYDGTQLRIWDGSAWELVGPGATVGPVGTTTIVFAMSSPSALTIGTNWTIVPYSGLPLTDTLNGWDQVQHRYLPTKAGMYNFMARGIPGAPGGGIAIVKNDNGTFTGGYASDIIPAIVSSTSGYWQQAEGFSPMNGTTDYVRVWAWGATSSWPSTGSNASFTATLMP